MNIDNERLVELLVQRATDSLSAAQEDELRRLLQQAGVDGTDDLELAVAAAWNAFAVQEATPGEAAPESLRLKLAADAERFFDPSDSAVTNLATAREARAGGQARRGGAPARMNWLGWAAAAMLAVAVIVTNLPSTAGPGGLAKIEQAPDTVVITWSRPESEAYAAVTGAVLWNDRLQQGYLRLAGMPVNDPQASQYQLWIVDPDRDANPVDGGVFDIASDNGEIVIPIDAKLRVEDPTLFAITREQPGGVVVSKGPLLVVASAG